MGVGEASGESGWGHLGLLVPHGPGWYQLVVCNKRGNALSYSPGLAGEFSWPLGVAL